MTPSEAAREAARRATDDAGNYGTSEQDAASLYRISDAFIRFAELLEQEADPNPELTP